MKISSFEWDSGNLEKLKKHRVSIELIEDFFAGPNLIIVNDSKHSFIESRFIAFGKYQLSGLFIVFTFRANAGTLKIRIISARYLHSKELRRLRDEIKN